MKLLPLAIFARKSFVLPTLCSCTLLSFVGYNQALAQEEYVNPPQNISISAPNRPTSNDYYYQQATKSLEQSNLNIPSPSAKSIHDFSGANNSQTAYGLHSLPADQANVNQSANNSLPNNTTSQATTDYADMYEPSHGINSEDAAYIEQRLGLKPANSVLFSDMVEADKIFASLNRDKFAFYIDREADKKLMWNKIFDIQKDVDGQVGIAVFDQDGLVLISNNSDFPLQGLSNFHLGYAVGALSLLRGEDLSKLVYFNTKSLKREVYSPMTELLMQSLGEVAASQNNVHIYDNNPAYPSGGQAVVESRAKALANVTRTIQAGNLKDLPKAPLRKIEAPTVQTNRVDLDELNTVGKVFSFDLSDLLYYSLGFADMNASDLLVSYLGSIEGLDLFCKSKGLKNTNFVHLNAQMWDNPELSYENSGPLYETAKLLALYSQDSSLSKEIKNCLSEIMYFDADGMSLIQRGVKESIEGSSSDDRATLQIYSHDGLGRVNKQGKRIVVSDLALIEYKGRSYIMVIAVKDLKGSEEKTQQMGQRVISKTAKVLFDYLKARDFGA